MEKNNTSSKYIVSTEVKSMNSLFLRFLATVMFGTLITTTSIKADSLDYSCAVSFNVKNRVFDYSPYGYPMSVSCPLLDKRRMSMYVEYTSIQGRSFAEAESKINSLSKKLESAKNSRNWKVFRAVGTQVVFYAGLASCSTGVGCAVGVAMGTLWHALDTVEGVSSIAEKQKAVDLILRELKKAQRTLAANKSNFELAKSSLAKEFNTLCSVVKQECL